MGASCKVEFVEQAAERNRPCGQDEVLAEKMINGSMLTASDHQPAGFYSAACARGFFCEPMAPDRWPATLRIWISSEPSVMR